MLTRVHSRSWIGRWRAAAVAGAALALALPISAYASQAQSQLVSTDPVDNTPSVVSTSGVSTPHVDAIANVGSTMFAGGLFNMVSAGGTQHARTNLMAFNRTTGALSSTFSASTNGTVWAMVADSSTNSVYVGGAFTVVNGVTFGPLVKLDATTGAIDTAFRPTFSSGQINDLELVTVGGVKHLFVGGTVAKKLMSLNLRTGHDDQYFNASITNPIPGAWGNGTAVYQFAVDPSATHLVATGNFLTVDGLARSRFFMMNLSGTGGSLASWYYPGFAKPCSSTTPRRIAYLQGVDWSPNGAAFDITATGQIPKNKSDIWYHRLGNANNANTTVCDAVGRFSLADPTKPLWINYTGGDSIWRVADTGVGVYAAGHFRWMDNPDGYSSLGIGDTTANTPAVRRPGIAAIAPTTGLALSWNPTLSNSRIGGKAFLVDSGGIWIGNDATKYGGENHYGLEYAPLSGAGSAPSGTLPIGDCIASCPNLLATTVPTND